MPKKKSSPRGPRADAPAPVAEPRTYTHPGASSPMRPDAGAQGSFRKKKAPKTYRYDSSLSPALDWDETNDRARDHAEKLLHAISNATSLAAAKRASEELLRLSRPFLNWAGKAERLSYDVPTLPLFVHERLSTKAILETLSRHKKDQQQDLDLFGDPHHDLTDQVLRAYEHRDKWVNRMILGDSLVVMNSLHEYEGLGGQVQMIYIDPPYGVKFGSNFQPFVKKRDVKHNDDADMTREPEMVQAYRDTWELGLHSYLTYLRDRLLVARDLLTPSGSVFVQISDENLHHLREVMDEVFGAENMVAVITVSKTSGQSSPSARTETIAVTGDFLVWYARDHSQVRYRQLFRPKSAGRAHAVSFRHLELPDGTRRPLSPEEQRNPGVIPAGARRFALSDTTAQKPTTVYDFDFEGRRFHPGRRGWRTTKEGMERLATRRRLVAVENSLRYVSYEDDFPVSPINSVWEDTGTGSFLEEKLYVVQTGAKVIERCIHMTTDPGDLVLDPTCGSGTTAYVAEQWGRRWITIDTSRVPLALARQRLLTASFPWYGLKDPDRGPAGGFVYQRRQNAKGEEVGGIVPHVTLKSIANDEPPAEEVLVDRPEIDKATIRVTGPFCVEATIPTPVDIDGDGVDDSGGSSEELGSYISRMLDVLRRVAVLRLEGNRTVSFINVRVPGRSLSLHAEAIVQPSALGKDASILDLADEAEESRGDRLALSGKPVAFVFGPENGAIGTRLVDAALMEAYKKSYTHLYVVGFGIEPSARGAIARAEEAGFTPATYVQATPDLLMGDLLKNMRSSQIFSVCGLPEIEIRKVRKTDRRDPDRYQVTLLGVDTFDPVDMTVDSLEEKDIPAWFLDSDYNEMVFRVTQAFFPKTEAWENLKRALKAGYEDSVWEHLRGMTSAPFEAPADAKVAVKVIDHRGNELMVVKSIAEAISA